MLYITAEAHYLEPLANEVRKEATFCSFLSSIPSSLKPHSTLSKALCATAPITLIPCAMISWNIYNAGSFQRHSKPFSLVSSGQREEIALRGGVLTRCSRIKESKRLIGAWKALSYEGNQFISEESTYTTVHIQRMDRSSIPKCLPASKEAYWYSTCWMGSAKKMPEGGSDHCKVQRLCLETVSIKKKHPDRKNGTTC